MKNEFALAFNEVLEDKQLPKEVILQAVQDAMVSAYRKAVNMPSTQRVEAIVNPETGQVTIYAEKEVVEVVQDERTEIELEQARQIDPTLEVGSLVMVECTPKDFGRVAAQSARQMIQQKIREAERQTQYEHFARQVGEIVSGVVQAFSNGNITLGLDLGAEAVLPRKEQIPGERFRIHERVRALLLEVKANSRGPQITLSRAHRNFLRRLLENEVPEIYHGAVDIRSIAREPGQRSKVAVAALKPGIDPVGACVGIRGVRIQAIVRELHDEKIDVIEWNPDPTIYIAKALSPARVVGVYLDEHAKGAKTAMVVVSEDQLSLAIGRDGQNARLAAKLTGWKIDIKSQTEAASDVLAKIQSDYEYGPWAEIEKESIPQVEMILTKKAEGRPVTPEEYQFISRFVDRVESGVIAKRNAVYKKREDHLRSAQSRIPATAFETPLESAGLSERLCKLLMASGFNNLGDLMLQMEIDSDAILKINGIGPKAMTEIEGCLAEYRASLPEITEAEEPISPEISPEVVEEIVEGAVEMPVLEETEVSAILTEEPEGDVSLPDEWMETEVAEVEPSFVVSESLKEKVEEEEREPESMHDLLVFDSDAFDVDEEEDEDSLSKKKKKRKYVEMEYDPDQGIMIVKRKRKRGGGWDSWDE